MAARMGVIFHVEMRPVPPGTWIYEDRRATYRGNVEVTFRYPDQYMVDPPDRVEPLRCIVFMVYIMHIPPAYRHYSQTPSSSAASASTHQSAFLGAMGPPARMIPAVPIRPAPEIRDPAPEAIRPLRLRIRGNSLAPTSQRPQYTIERIPAEVPTDRFYTSGPRQTTPYARIPGQTVGPSAVRAPVSGGIRNPRPEEDIPGPSSRMIPIKRSRVDVVISSTDEEETEQTESD